MEVGRGIRSNWTDKKTPSALVVFMYCNQEQQKNYHIAQCIEKNGLFISSAILGQT